MCTWMMDLPKSKPEVSDGSFDTAEGWAGRRCRLHVEKEGDCKHFVIKVWVPFFNIDYVGLQLRISSGRQELTAEFKKEEVIYALFSFSSQGAEKLDVESSYALLPDPIDNRERSAIIEFYSLTPSLEHLAFADQGLIRPV